MSSDKRTGPYLQNVLEAKFNGVPIESLFPKKEEDPREQKPAEPNESLVYLEAALTLSKLESQRLLEGSKTKMFKPTLENVRAHFATAGVGIKPEDITALGPNIGPSRTLTGAFHDMYPVGITSMSACEYMRDNYPSLVRLGYNNMLSIGQDSSMRLVYVR